MLNSQNLISFIFFFAIIINSISLESIISIILRISLKSLLILFLITAVPIFFVTINLVFILLTLFSFLFIYTIKYFLLIYMPSLNILFISSSFLMLSRILIFPSGFYADKTFLPFLLLFAIILRPDFVLILCIKPCFFFLFLTFG